jgi:hypothetical protein
VTVRRSSPGIVTVTGCPRWAGARARRVDGDERARTRPSDGFLDERAFAPRRSDSKWGAYRTRLALRTDRRSSGYRQLPCRKLRPCGVWCVVCGVWCVVCGVCSASSQPSSTSVTATTLLPALSKSCTQPLLQKQLPPSTRVYSAHISPPLHNVRQRGTSCGCSAAVQAVYAAAQF